MFLAALRRRYARRHPRWFCHAKTRDFVWSNGTTWDVFPWWNGDTRRLAGPGGIDLLKPRPWTKFLLPRFVPIAPSQQSRQLTIEDFDPGIEYEKFNPDTGLF